MKNIYLIFIFLAGLAMIIMGLKMIFSHIIFFKNAIIVPGTIVRYEERMDRDSRTRELRKWYSAVVSFSLDGEIREAKTKISATSPSQGNIGKICKVAINPKNLNEIRIDSIWNILFFSAFLIFFGVLCSVITFILSPYSEKLFSLLSHFLSNYVPSSPNTALTLAVLIKIGFKIFICLIFLASLIPGGIGTWLLYSRITFFKNAIIVPGTVVRYDEHKERSSESHKKITMYTEVVSYTYNGRTKEIISNMSSSEFNPEGIGATCKVGVNPQNPYEARIYSKWDFAIGIGLICFSGILLLFILKLFL